MTGQILRLLASAFRDPNVVRVVVAGAFEMPQVAVEAGAMRVASAAILRRARRKRPESAKRYQILRRVRAAPGFRRVASFDAVAPAERELDRRAHDLHEEGIVILLDMRTEAATAIGRFERPGHIRYLYSDAASPEDALDKLLELYQAWWRQQRSEDS